MKKVPPIRDNYQYKKLEAELKQFRSLGLVRPLFYLLGPSGWKAASAISHLTKDELPKLEEQFERLRSLPDRFNTCFAAHGWIAHEDLNIDVAERAVQLAEQGNSEEAEAVLEEHYNQVLPVFISRLVSLPALRDRRRLIELAVADHQAGRYYASVPVILSQIDGITEEQCGSSFYKRGPQNTKKLQATETIAGHPTSLPQLADLLGQTRTDITTDPISTPYRNGILHGVDLGYDTRRNSTKCFAVLLAMRPWLLKVLQEEQFKVPEVDYIDPETATWEDVKAEWRKLVRVVRDSVEAAQRREQ